MALACNVAVVGATGSVGEVLLALLDERNFPVERLYPLASAHSAGSTVMFRGKPKKVELLDNFDFSKVKVVFFSAGKSISSRYAQQAADSGCVVIDNTSCFRADPSIPLIIPEVNLSHLANFNWHKGGIIANPNCSTIQMLVALKPIHDAAVLKRVEVVTYQAVSGLGRKGIEILALETAQLLNGQSVSTEESVFFRQIAFNVVPHIDTFGSDGYTREEMKMVDETRKILNNADVLVNPTCVRIPVFYGHSMALHIETEHKLWPQEAEEVLSNAPGVKVSQVTDEGNLCYPTPVSEAVNRDEVFVGRIRNSLSYDCGLNMWVVADNVRKGAALNSVQIVEYLLNSV